MLIRWSPNFTSFDTGAGSNQFSKGMLIGEATGFVSFRASLAESFVSTLPGALNTALSGLSAIDEVSCALRTAELVALAP